MFVRFFRLFRGGGGEGTKGVCVRGRGWYDDAAMKNTAKLIIPSSGACQKYEYVVVPLECIVVAPNRHQQQQMKGETPNS